MNNDSDHRIREPRIAEFPALAALGLTAGDLAELARQGFVCQERRGQRTYHKLRFRRGGKQVVRYIGSADRAANVNDELAVLQSQVKNIRDLQARVSIANRVLRESKRTLEPVLHASGYAFHGLAIRRPRQRPTVKTTHSSS